MKIVRIQHADDKFKMNMLRVICLLLVLNFLPDNVWSMVSSEQHCMQLMEESMPESGEEPAGKDSNEESSEDTADSFIDLTDSPANTVWIYSGSITDHRIVNLRDLAHEIISPPPRRG